MWLKISSCSFNDFIHIFLFFLSAFPLIYSILLCNSLWLTPCRLKTYFLHARYLLTVLFCNCSRWEGKTVQSSLSVCYCYSTVHSFHECVTSPAHPSSLSLLCKFVPASQSVHCSDKGLHHRHTTYRTGMLSEITGNRHLKITSVL